MGLEEIDSIPEPFIGSADETGLVPFDILNVVDLGCEGILDIDDDDFPVGLALVKKGHDAKNFDLLDLANVANLFADLADIERVVVSASLGFSVRDRGVFPGL